MEQSKAIADSGADAALKAQVKEEAEAKAREAEEAMRQAEEAAKASAAEVCANRVARQRQRHK